MTLTLKSIVALLATITAALALAACGSDDEETGSASTAKPVAAKAFPVTVEHKFGSTTIESAPKRVVSAGYTDSDTLLALGVTPVAVREFIGGYDYKQRPWAQDALGGREIETVGGEELNIEAIAAQRPDLIIAVTSGISKRDYEKLSKVAPTIPQSGDFIDFGMPWRDQTRLIAKAVGQSERAERLIADVEARFDAAIKQHPEFERASAIVGYGSADGYGAHASGDTRVRFFSDLGFKVPKKVDELAGDKFFVDFSQEHFRLLDQDVVIAFAKAKQFTGEPAVRRLDAVREERVIYVDLTDHFAGALGYSSVLSLPFLIDQAVPMLAAAVDGDAKTKIEQPR